MKILLAVSNKKNSTVLYVADDGHTYTTKEMLARAKNAEIDGVHVVTRQGKSYLRINKKSNFLGIDTITLAARRLVFDPTDTEKLLREKALTPYLNYYQKKLAEREKDEVIVVGIDNKYTPFATREHVIERVVPLKEYIFEAAIRFKIGPFFLAAIIIDEVVRLAPIESILDKVSGEYMSMNVSVGIAQVKLNTARSLVKEGLTLSGIESLPRLDKLLVHTVRNSVLYVYVVNPRNNIVCAAAFLQFLRDEWKRVADIEISDAILATLYHLRHRVPHVNPEPDERGLQIVSEFYELAKKILQK